MAVNLSRLKSYAPKARCDFRKAVEERAARLGIAENGIADAQEQGEVVLIGGVAYSKAVGKQRKDLVGQIRSKGFDQVIEEVAYTWFNRFVAIRFMELHGFLGHAYAVFSNPDPSKPFPQILDGAEHLDFPGLPQQRVREIKAAGDYEEKLYRAILLAQCNVLHKAMPFLFERIGDATELLLPDSLLATDGLVRKLVAASSAEDWANVEVIGWLYQFYISEKKDQVFAGLKKNQKITPANIPAATQLFTPHWIVRYLVENSLGRLWMLNRPNSGLAAHMDYYIAPETPEEDFLRISSPEEIKVCDPACGSGHMLTYAFDLLYRIYEDEGYRAREIPELILTKNLHGIEIDDRAGALSAFCLTMKARMKDARFFERRAEPQICVMEDVAFTSAEMQDVAAVVGRDLFTDELRETLPQFEQAKNFGSLIVPKLREPSETLRVVEARDFASDLLLKEVQERVIAVLRMSEALSPKYHVVAANPPYMGGNGMNPALRNFLKSQFKECSNDLYAAFMWRLMQFVKANGISGIMTPFTWMYLSSFEKLRKIIVEGMDLQSLVKPQYHTLFDSAAVPISAYCIARQAPRERASTFFDLEQFKRREDQAPRLREAIIDRSVPWRFDVPTKKLKAVPGTPVAFSLSDGVLKAFATDRFSHHSKSSFGIKTGNNDKFLLAWHEVELEKADLNADGSSFDKRWYPCASGGTFRRWYGNSFFVVDYEGQGKRIEKYAQENGNSYGFNGNRMYFKRLITWPKLTSSKNSFRATLGGHIFDGVGLSAEFPNESDYFHALLAANSAVITHITPIIAPTMSLTSGDFDKLPFLSAAKTTRDHAEKLIETFRSDWDAYETSWDFTTLPLLSPDHRAGTLEATYTALRARWQSMTDEMQRLEEGNNRIFIDAYALQDELTPEVPIEEITLTCNPAYRYGGKRSDADLEDLLRADTVKELLSYAVGCMMGRYSLVQPGLIYANAGNDGFDPTRYDFFPADDDGIIPVTGTEWFKDDAASRCTEFLRQTWGKETLGENLEFIADNLDRKPNESAGDTVRRFFSRSFFKDHLRRYKNRPIYWLFSSGKERAFECLVYLHRYNENTLGRMRMEYVIPLQTKMANKLQAIEREIASGGLSSAALKARTREQTSLQAQVTELERFEANLRHMADERIALDLDDGVKVNYGKFGNLLAEVKTVTGSKEEA